jgi:hypothetical protein
MNKLLSSGIALSLTLLSSLSLADAPSSREQAVAAKADRYLVMSQATLDSHGWIRDTHCDGLLFNGLYASVGGPARIDDAEELRVITTPSGAQIAVPTGKWHRHWEQDCYANNQLPPQLRPPGKSSGSTISRDMLMGLLHWAWTYKRLDVIDRFIAYGEAHTVAGLPLVWSVGEGDASRVTVSPGLTATFYEMRERLGGAAAPPGVTRIEGWGRCSGYECHLQALHVLLYLRMRGTVSEGAREAIVRIAEEHPRNALYQAVRYRVDGDEASRQRAFDTLLDPGLFPENRLPGSADRCNDYIFSRDEVKDGQTSPSWLPCNEGLTFSGVDLLLASATVLHRI